MTSITPTDSSSTAAADRSTPDLAPVQNVNVVSIRTIISPKQLDQELPKSPIVHKTVIDGRETIRRILRGEDKRLLVVIGPSTVHEPVAAL